MYDLHCHLLPGVDDGPASWEEAVELAWALADEGVTVVGATPHGYGSGQSRVYERARLQPLADELRARIAGEGLGLRVVLGHELYLLPDLPRRLQEGHALPYEGSRTVLLESPGDRISSALERAIFELQVAGYRVLLAHPERTRQVQESPGCLLPLVEKGVCVQVTAASLTGDHGRTLRRTAEALLTAGMCQVLSSDAHRATGSRSPLLKRAHAVAAELVGPEAARAMVYDVPAALLDNARLPAPMVPLRPIERKRRWFF